MSDLDSNNTMFYTLFNQLSENEQKSHDAIIGIVSIIYKEFLKTKNIDGLISKDDVNQHNLLQRMIYENNYEIIEMLLLTKCDVNHKSNCNCTRIYDWYLENDTPMQFLKRFTHVVNSPASKIAEKIFFLLISSGATIEDQYNLHFMPTYMIKEIIKQKIIKDDKVYLLFGRSSADTLYLVMQNMTDINIKNEDGDALIHIACRYSMYNNIQKLIELECDVDIINNAGKRPLQLYLSNYICCNNDCSYQKCDCQLYNEVLKLLSDKTKFPDDINTPSINPTCDICKKPNVDFAEKYDKFFEVNNYGEYEDYCFKTDNDAIFTDVNKICDNCITTLLNKKHLQISSLDFYGSIEGFLDEKPIYREVFNKLKNKIINRAREHDLINTIYKHRNNISELEDLKSF
jgi:hypothetical protein